MMKKSKMNICDLFEEDGFILKPESDPRGIFNSACPNCKVGDDRCIIRPNDKNGLGHYWCRICEKSGNVIQYLKDFRGMNFKKACYFSGNGEVYENWISGKKGEKISEYRPETYEKTFPWEPRELDYPNDLWREKALEFVNDAQDMLWDYEDGEEILDWLNNERCLNDKTIEKFQLGFLEQGYKCERDIWGLESVDSNNAEMNTIMSFPSGLVIPSIENGKIFRLHIRRFNPGNYSRYKRVAGSSSHLFVTGSYEYRTVVIVESELDAILLSQEIKDELMIIALGGVTFRPDKNLTEIIDAMDHVLIALDTDEAGSREYKKFWKEYFPKSRQYCIPPQYGKDPTEAMLNGLDLDRWYRSLG